MEEGIDVCVSWRNAVLAPVLLADPLRAVGLHLALATTSILLTAAIVEWLAPGAAGAGVSLVIAFLNGNNIAGLMTPAVYCVKLFGTWSTRMAGLALGPEAPMVHLGACVASLLFGAERRLWGDNQKKKYEGSDPNYANWRHDFDPAFSNAGHREMVSAGAAAGMAAAFGAPVGGVLFALEEACSVWSRKTAWRCLICTATAVFTMTQLVPSVAGGGILSLSGIYPLSSRQWLKQLPFVSLLSAGAGLLGAAFNLMRRGVQGIRAARRRHTLRLLEAALVAAVSVITIAIVSGYVGRCLDIPQTWETSDVMQWQCKDGQYNDLATALLGSSPFVVRSILGLGSESEPINNICTLDVPCYFSVWSLVTLCAVYLILMVLSAGLAIPGGMFMPSVIVGGSFGAVCGMLLTAVLPPSWDVQPGVYAMVGSVATMAAVFRSSISLVVIMVEGTGGIDFLPGILAATIISNFIAHWLHPDGVYESELERDGRVFFLRQEAPGMLRWRTAESIMASPLTGLKCIEEVGRIVEVLTTTLHNGFPVHPIPGDVLDGPGSSSFRDRGGGTTPRASPGGIRPENGVKNSKGSLHHFDEGDSRRLDGFILRTQLLVLLQERAFCDAQGRYLAPPRDVSQYESYLDSIMQSAELSCDGLGGAAEMALAVDPLGRTESSEKEEDAVAPALVPTLETLETLRNLPSMRRVIDEQALAAIIAQVDAEQNNGGSCSDEEEDSNRRAERSRWREAPPTPRHAAPVLYLNLEPFMDKGMLTVRPDTPATSLHKMFVALSLRHLCVVDSNGNVAGMITRKDLDNAGGHGPWRQNKMAPGPHRDGLISRRQSWFGAGIQALNLSNIMQRIGGSPATSTVGGDSPYPAATLGAPEVEEGPTAEQIAHMHRMHRML